jgi:hypothetical protein
VFNETLLNDVKYAQQMAPESWKVTTIGATYFVHDSNEFIPDLLAINMGHGYTRACDVLRKAAPPYTDLTGLLVRLDLELYERVKPLSGNLRVRDLIDEAYKYWKDRDAWLRDRRWMIIPEEHITFALQKVAEVSAVIGARRRANLPATSLAWECIGSFEYDWPEGQPQLLNPQILVSPSSLDFGEVLICCDRTETEAITIQNTGPGWLIITSIQTDSERFSNPKLDFAIIKPGDTLNLNISFSPTPEGSAQGMLSISSDDPASPTHVQLSGVGIHKPPTIRVEPLSLVLDFGRVLQDTEYTKAFTLRNLVSESLIIYSATIENPTPPDGVFRIEEFSQEIECLERGQLRVNCIVFDELTHSATIKVRYGDTGSNRSELSLTVEAIGSPVECGELASQLTNLEEDLATATGQERARVLQQIAVVKAQMRQLGCGPN